MGFKSFPRPSPKAKLKSPLAWGGAAGPCKLIYCVLPYALPSTQWLSILLRPSVPTQKLFPHSPLISPRIKTRLRFTSRNPSGLQENLTTLSLAPTCSVSSCSTF